MNAQPFVSHEAGMQEVVDRCRRMETRLTRFLESQGFDTQVKRAVWLKSGQIVVPTPAVAVKECLSVIPSDWPIGKPIIVVHKGEILCRIQK